MAGLAAAGAMREGRQMDVGTLGGRVVFEKEF